MDQTIFYPSYRVLIINISNAVNIYHDGNLTEEGLIIYSFVTPIICLFGIVGNAITLVVLSRRELKGSVYVYLAVLAFADFCSSILLFLSGLSCGAFFVNSRWPIYDVLFGLPLATLFNTLGVLTTIMVTFDRICYLKNPLRRKKPKFCHIHIARKTVIVCILISVVTTIPYCFIFAPNAKGEIVPRKFYYSRLYAVFNWARFMIFAVFTSIYLIVGNGYLIYGLHRVKKMYSKCNDTIKNRKPQNYTNLTVTLILIVFIFVINQIPSMLTSRVASTTFFYPSSTDADETKCNSKFLESIREISTLITAICLGTNFLLYYLFCPPFVKSLEKIFTRKKRSKAVQMTVFVLEKPMCLDKKSINDLATEKVFQGANFEGNRESTSIYDGSCDRYEDEDTKLNRDTLMTICSRNII